MTIIFFILERYMNIEKLAIWSHNCWNIYNMYDCFNIWIKSEKEKKYWNDKYNPNILEFYVSLDQNDRFIFGEYLEKTIKKYEIKK